MTTEQYLLELIAAKNDMKEALREKGVEVWGGLNTYPDAIRELTPMSVLIVYDGTKFSGSTWDSLPSLDTSNVTDMRGMFSMCSSLTTMPQLDTSNVTDMYGMFYQCSSLTNIPQLNTSNVTDMSYMFYDCSSLTTIPQLDTSNVTNMSVMFAYCSSLTTILQLDTSNVTDMSYMFGGCGDLREVKFVGEVPSGVQTKDMFYNCKDLKMYYPNRFADSYEVIIQELPSSCVAVGYDE